MLTYLILTTRALLMATVIAAVICGYTNQNANQGQRRIVWCIALLGVVASIVVAYLRNGTNLLDSAILNGWIYAISLLSFLLFVIFTYTPLARKENAVTRTVPWVLLGILLFTLIVYATPEVWGYPYHVWLSEKTLLSTDFLLSMIGVVLALVLMVVAFFAVEKSTRVLSLQGAKLLLLLELLLNAAVRISGLFSVLFQKAIIKSNHTLFTYTVFVKNHSDWFIYLSLAMVVVVSVVLWVQSYQQKEPYKNPAEHRKIRAKWRRIRQWATAIAVVSVLGVCNLTVVEAMNETDVTLSPVEDATSVDSQNIYVGFDLVSDGHLHRFAYTSPDGVEIRFIVIQKPNSQAYGIGLDACDVCGETGYYEKDGQVVCNLCDVVMNISTIGFKGGCNPIVIPYEMENGQIVVPIAGLMEYESEFK